MSQYNIILRRKRGARIFERLLDKIESEMNAVNRLQPEMIDFEKKSSEEKSGDTQLDDARTYALASDNEPSFNGLISTLTTSKLSRVDSLHSTEDLFGFEPKRGVSNYPPDREYDKEIQALLYSATKRRNDRYRTQRPVSSLPPEFTIGAKMPSQCPALRMNGQQMFGV
ncbi:hypothetical protein V8E53_012682 [Lactarius tabidus]